MLTDNCLLEENAGFRSGRGYIVPIFVIWQLAEKIQEKGNKIFAASVGI